MLVLKPNDDDNVNLTFGALSVDAFYMPIPFSKKTMNSVVKIRKMYDICFGILFWQFDINTTIYAQVVELNEFKNKK